MADDLELDVDSIIRRLLAGEMELFVSFVTRRVVCVSVCAFPDSFFTIQ